MKKFLVTLLAVAGLFTTFAPMGQAAEVEVQASYIEIEPTWWGTITVNNLNFRTGPGTHYPSLGQIHQGTSVFVLETRAGWHRISIHSGVNAGRTGWVITAL